MVTPGKANPDAEKTEIRTQYDGEISVEHYLQPCQKDGHVQ